MSRQIRPSLSATRGQCHVGGPGERPLAPMLGWYILVRKRTLGGAMGYSSGRNNSSLKTPSDVRIRGGANKATDMMTRRTLERTAIWALDSHIKIPQIVVVRGSRYSGCRVCHKALRFLEMVGGKRRLRTKKEGCCCSGHAP